MIEDRVSTILAFYNDSGLLELNLISIRGPDCMNGRHAMAIDWFGHRVIHNLFKKSWRIYRRVYARTGVPDGIEINARKTTHTLYGQILSSNCVLFRRS